MVKLGAAASNATEGTVPEFDLFISYVRQDVRRDTGRQNIDVVGVLKSELERHRRPKDMGGRNKRFRVCTDVDDFALDGTFDKVMRARIAQSRYFLLVATPGVRNSKFVQRELEILEDLGPIVGRLAAVLGASLEDVAPNIFEPDTLAADLDQPSGTSANEWRTALRRESHKIVAKVWRLEPQLVFDRFEAVARKVRRQIVLAGVGVTLALSAITIGLAGQSGYHRATELPMDQRVVAPAGVGFAAYGQTPILIDDKRAFVWNDGLSQEPKIFSLPFPTLHAVTGAPGKMVLSGLYKVGIVSFPGANVLWTRRLPKQIEGIAANALIAAASMKDGSLAFLNLQGRVSKAPRPRSQIGRRFPAMRETGPYIYGELLALNDELLVSATLSGRLGLFYRRTERFVTAAKPQFPLAHPIETIEDPILYETENTRPISALAFLKNGDIIFSESSGLRLVDRASGKLTKLRHCDIGLVRELLPLPDGKTIVALTSSTFEVLRFAPNDRGSLQCLQRTTLNPKFAPRAVLAADGKTILVAYFDGRPEVWRPGFKIFGVLLPRLW